MIRNFPDSADLASSDPHLFQFPEHKLWNIQKQRRNGLSNVFVGKTLDFFKRKIENVLSRLAVVIEDDYISYDNISLTYPRFNSAALNCL